jgi:hypothetical protein
MSTAPQQQPSNITVVQMDLQQLADMISAKLARDIAEDMATMKTELAVVKTRLNYISLGWLGAVAVFIFAVIKLAGMK